MPAAHLITKFCSRCEQGNQQAGEGDAGGSEEHVRGLEHHGECVHLEVSGHLHQAQTLLQQGEHYSQHQSAAQSEQGHEPAFEHEYPFQKAVPGSGGAQRAGVVTLLDDEHGEGAEDVEGHDDDHEEQD